ncbi:MAG TPA: type II toxin-antitoxin system VapC family toxin [Thermoanaerobaculia bacterium]|nr:type II toxin-antitoxin system VapC family toxin [Thermoanaerobaculia bacterium]
MILYLDTSSLVKLYVDEDFSEIVREWVEAAEAVATSRVTYPEALSAFTRRWNRGDLTDEEMSLARESFAGDWPMFVLLPVNERRAGGLVLEHLLRGFDAIHLAAAEDLAERFPAEEVVFSSFDAALLRAARTEGLSTLHPTVLGGFVMEDSGLDSDVYIL